MIFKRTQPHTSELIIHIGMPKAASSSIQWAARRANSKTAELALLRKEDKNSTPFLMAALTTETDIRENRLDKTFGSLLSAVKLRTGDARRAQRKIRKVLKTGSNLFISSEEIFAQPHMVTLIAQRLAPIFTSVRIICVLRPLGTWLPSHISEIIKKATNPNLSATITKDVIIQWAATIKKENLNPWSQSFKVTFIDYRNDPVDQVLNLVYGDTAPNIRPMENISESGEIALINYAARTNASLVEKPITPPDNGGPITIDPILLNDIETDLDADLQWIHSISGINLAGERPLSSIVINPNTIDQLLTALLNRLDTHTKRVTSTTLHKKYIES